MNNFNQFGRVAGVIPGSFPRSTEGLVSIGNGEYVDAQSPEGRAMMGLPPTQQEKYNTGIEAMKQFNLGAFQRAAPGTIFGQGDSGFQSPTMKASEMGFNNIYNSLFGMGAM